MSANSVLPLETPQEQDWPSLWSLAQKLHELGYHEQNISQAMQLEDHATRNFAAWPAHARNCRKLKETHPYALLAAFFLIEESVEEAELRAVLGDVHIDLMQRLHWIQATPGTSKLHFRYFLYPLLGSFFLTDGHVSNPNGLNQVYLLGTDSHCLARLAPRPRVGMSLDHCTGSGVQAILAGPHSERVFGLDINPRALDFARFNARWNKQEQVRFVASDCYQNVNASGLQIEGEPRFDLITANPPFVPTPVTLELCRGGGLSGEEVTEKIIRGLPEKLSPRGVFSMITNVPVFEGQTFFERCQSWLDQGSWGMAMLSYHTWTVPSYVMAHLTPRVSESYGEGFIRWLEAFEEIGLRSVLNSQVYLFRSAFPWRIDRRFDYPTQKVSPFIEAWLDSLRAFEPGGGARFQLHPELEKVWWDEAGERVYLEWSSQQRWWQPKGLWLEGAGACAVRALQEHPEGCTAAQLDTEGLTRLLEDHLATLV
jgi:SAM-dependent methyltransferase